MTVDSGVHEGGTAVSALAPVSRLQDSLVGSDSKMALTSEVEDWLRPYIHSWLHVYLEMSSDVLERVCIQLRRPQPNSARDFLSSLNPSEYADVVHMAIQFGYLEVQAGERDDEDLLFEVSRLETILSDSGFYLAATTRGLEYRVDPTVVAAAESAVGEARKFGKHNAAVRLESAWEKAYSLDPDPTESIAEAIRAVEAVMLPTVVPKDLKAIYSKGVGALRDNKDKWRLAIETQNGADDIDVVISMLNRLGTAHLERHEGNVAKGVDTVESARACVHLAATLVQWFSMGAVVKR